MYNFIDIETKEKLFIPKFHTLIKDGYPQYRDWKTGKILNVKKINTKLSTQAIRTDTKNR